MNLTACSSAQLESFLLLLPDSVYRRRAVPRRITSLPICAWRSTASPVIFPWVHLDCCQSIVAKLLRNKKVTYWFGFWLAGISPSHKERRRTKKAQPPHQYNFSHPAVYHCPQYHCGVVDFGDRKGKEGPNESDLSNPSCCRWRDTAEFNLTAVGPPSCWLHLFFMWRSRNSPSETMKRLFVLLVCRRLVHINILSLLCHFLIKAWRLYYSLFSIS